MVDQTLQCIRESMISLLQKKDYGKIQMKEIAENAHVGRKTLYRYFDSKEQIGQLHRRQYFRTDYAGCS